jgi:hypothetical protein
MHGRPVGLFDRLRGRIDRADPSRCKIEWDEVPDSREVGKSAAEQLAAAMRGEQVAGGFTTQSVEIVGDVSSLTDDQRAKLEMLGIDLETLVNAAQAGTTVTWGAPDDGAGDDARLARLERLAALRAQGVLTDAECEEQKRRILG